MTDEATIVDLRNSLDRRLKNRSFEELNARTNALWTALVQWVAPDFEGDPLEKKLSVDELKQIQRHGVGSIYGVGSRSQNPLNEWIGYWLRNN